MNENIINKLLINGVNNLKDFGYTNVNEENILTDMIYSQFFLNMLKQNLGLGFDNEVSYLITRIEG